MSCSIAASPRRRRASSPRAARRDGPAAAAVPGPPAESRTVADRVGGRGGGGRQTCAPRLRVFASGSFGPCLWPWRSLHALELARQGEQAKALELAREGGQDSQTHSERRVRGDLVAGRRSDRRWRAGDRIAAGGGRGPGRIPGRARARPCADRPRVHAPPRRPPRRRAGGPAGGSRPGAQLCRRRSGRDGARGDGVGGRPATPRAPPMDGTR